MSNKDGSLLQCRLRSVWWLPNRDIQAARLFDTCGSPCKTRKSCLRRKTMITLGVAPRYGQPRATAMAHIPAASHSPLFACVAWFLEGSSASLGFRAVHPPQVETCAAKRIGWLQSARAPLLRTRDGSSDAKQSHLLPLAAARPPDFPQFTDSKLPSPLYLNPESFRPSPIDTCSQPQPTTLEINSFPAISVADDLLSN